MPNVSLDLRSRTAAPTENGSGSAITRALIERILGSPLLPSPPILALQIVEQVSDPNCDFEVVSRLLAQDPSVCGKLLKIVNSIMYSPSKPITSINRALALLGLKRVRSLVLGLSLPAMQIRSEADRNLKAYWNDSVCGAIIARELGLSLAHPEPEDGMVAALLRDLGKVLLHQTFPQEYRPIWRGELSLLGRDLCAWEEEHIGINHAEVSAALLYRWRLPPELVEPIRHHHSPETLFSAPPALANCANLLEFASRLTQLENTPRGPEFYQAILDTARSHFGMDRARLEAFLADVQPKIHEFARVLNLEIGDCPNFAEVLTAGCEAFVGLSMESTIAPEPVVGRNESWKEAETPGTPAAATASSPPPANGNLADQGLDLLSRLNSGCLPVRIQNYEIRELVGKGAMGVVYKAQDLALDRCVAVKMLVPERARCAHARSRFAREARTAAQIHHENVVGIFAVSEQRGNPFLVMEFVRGQSLQDWIDVGRRFTNPEIIQIARQIAVGLAVAHSLRLIHRDIKPANILMEAGSDRVKISDFGLARGLDEQSRSSQDGLLVGTPLFMSPEQVSGKRLDPKSDMFSLGSLLYNLCTNEVPFFGDSFFAILQSVLVSTAKPVRERNPAVPARLANLIENLHAKEPQLRLSAAQMADELAKM